MVSDEAVGFILCLVSALGFGTMYSPVKNYEKADGFFVMFCQSTAIMFCGTLVWVVQGFPELSPAAFLGGIILTTGNMTAIPIVNMVGMGLGIMIWGSVQIIVGWATGRFGLFGLPAEVPVGNLNNALQYIGVALTLVSAGMFAFVKYSHPDSEDEQEDPILDEETRLTKLPKKRNWNTMIFALGLGTFGGICYGEMLTPVTYVQVNVPGASQNGLDYAFPFSIGVLASATLYFGIYCMMKRNKPFLNAQVILPSFVYGTLWSVAFFSWLVSATKISPSITFPINTRLPGVIASIWGVLVFKEVQGVSNLLTLLAAITVAVTGVVLVGLSDVL